ncbi:MAG: ATP-binding cassette domain-containing protein, partial [Clostridiales bacterium]|nr:ATP-binding cassette domain-containing protein [Clostridiales bacterium]
MPYIEARNLTKTYYVKPMKPNLKGAVKSLFKREKQIITALDNVTFEINQHELIGYIGPNGAGKSTLIKLLAGSSLDNSINIQKGEREVSKEIKIGYFAQHQLEQLHP